MYKLSLINIFKLFKSAAQDIPEFYPEWVKKHPELEKIKSLRDVKKEMPIPDYRESIPFDDEFKEILQRSVMSSAFRFTTYLFDNIDMFIEHILTVRETIRYNLLRKFDHDSKEFLILSRLFYPNAYSNNPQNIPPQRSQISESVDDLFGEIEEEQNIKLPLESNSNSEIDVLQILNEEDKNMYLKERFFSAFIKILNNIRDYLSNNSSSMYSEIIANPKLSEVISLHTTISEKVLVSTPKGIFNKTIVCQSGTPLEKIFKNLVKDYKSLTGDNFGTPLSNLSLANEYKKLTQTHFNMIKTMSNPQLDLVFSTRPEDLLSMSIRSEWTSCQDLIRKNKNSNNVRAIFSAISPYVGIIYLTNKTDYYKRGEEMLGRALVLFLENEEGGPPIIFLSKIYSTAAHSKIEKIFKKSLSEKTSLQIISGDTESLLGPGSEYYFPSEFAEEEKNPYFDYTIKTKKK